MAAILTAATAAEARDARTRPYQPFGVLEEAWYCRAGETLIAGPAGTGKSRLALERLHYLAETYPGMRALLVRKTRASLTESGLVTFEDKVVPVGHPILDGAQRAHRQAYHYPNGSTLVIGGMDNPTRIMSTEYDLIYVQEAIELDEHEWEMLTTRLRAGNVPWAQLVADTNPDAPTHWLYRRCQAGKTRLFESRHEDNPTVTPEYLAKLDALSGVRRERLRWGKWVAAEGTVYEEWDRRVHLIDRFDIPREWPRYWAIDFGFVAPFVFQAYAKDPDGRLYGYREIYRTQRLVEDHARDIRAVMEGEPNPVAVICDTDAEDRATLERHLKRGTVPAFKDVSPGIQAVAARLRVQADGRPRLFFLRDSLVARDPELEERKKPCCTVEEFDVYVWSDKVTRRYGEEPVKEYDHGMDALRYCVAYVDRVGAEGGPVLGVVVLDSARGWSPTVQRPGAGSKTTRGFW